MLYNIQFYQLLQTLYPTIVGSKLQVIYLSERLPVQQVTEPFRSVPLDDALTTGLATEFIHVLQEKMKRGGRGRQNFKMVWLFHRAILQHQVRKYQLCKSKIGEQALQMIH